LLNALMCPCGTLVLLTFALLVRHLSVSAGLYLEPHGRRDGAERPAQLLRRTPHFSACLVLSSCRALLGLLDRCASTARPVWGSKASSRPDPLPPLLPGV
jgi:hypothetical protein